MVGLVIVSHSRALADALVGLVHQVAVADLPIAIAAGIGEDRREFGTDAVEIMEAIQSVYSDAGVVVLMDLGSAILSANLALELLPPEIADKIRFCGAPLVEGAIAAAVQSGLNSDLETVCREANAALTPKREQLGEEKDESNAPLQADDEAAKFVILTLTNLHGLHARPAAKFVQTAARFTANVTVSDLTNGKGPVSARSLNAIATLGAVENHQIRITATGPEADAAIHALQALVEDNFGEPITLESVSPVVEVVPAKAAMAANGSLQAVSISEGISIGPLYHYRPQMPSISTEPARDPNAESQKLERALELVRNNIRTQIRQLKTSVGEANAAILEAHLLIAQDPELVEQALNNIFQNHQNAALAWHNATEQIIASYHALEDDYLKQRAADVKDVENQILLALAGKTTTAPLTFTGPIILYAQDLTPTETAQFNLSAVLGIITTGGGSTSHSAILARALGIPAVAGASMTLASLPMGTLVALDGSSGQIWIDPSENFQAEMRARRESWLASRQKLLQASAAPAVTLDGHRVEVFANIGNVQDATAAVKNGAEGVGLLRTEFLFLTRETPPSEEEQTITLRQIFETMGSERPITTRTLDVGGDKKLPYIQLPEEANPFLGVRALRLSLTRPDLFLPQLRAILRAAHGFHCRIMFPMVADGEEIRKARECVEKAHHELTEENQSHAWPVELGIMIEIPSAALLAPILADEVDFFSLGTNDLTQYTLAAERGNPALSHLADGLHPAVLRLINQVVEAAHQAGKWAGVCGELGGDPEAIPVLVGLGVDELSLNSAGIPRIKSIIRDLNMEAARALAAQALRCRTGVEVRQLARTFRPSSLAADNVFH